MQEYGISSSYYVIIKDGHLFQGSFNDDIGYEVIENEHVFTFSNDRKLEVHFVYDCNEKDDYCVKYVLNKGVIVDIIETRILNNGASLNKKVILNEESELHIFNENQSHNNEEVYFDEDVKLLRNAKCEVGYSELASSSLKAKYHYELKEEGAQVQLRMAAMANDDKKSYEIEIGHYAPHTMGKMDNYGVVLGKGSLTIDGIGRITKGQYGSESHQTNKIIVFDELCNAKANPYLYIDEYDVKASHAAAVGKMDEEHLFYLQSRGLSKKQSMKLITYGYLRPVSEIIDNEMTKKRFEKMLSEVGDYDD